MFALSVCCMTGARAPTTYELLITCTYEPTFLITYCQVLRYEAGQFYKTHHDQNSPRASAWGPRMFTVFMCVQYTNTCMHMCMCMCILVYIHT